jgi:NADH dehydrogenase (ubiquinone) 1 alpha subcomplex subunit 2
MSGKYVFSKALKELRFLHCQTSEHSNAVRYVATGHVTQHDNNLEAFRT